MIRTLTGTVREARTESLVLEVGGIGYLVTCPTSLTSNIGADEELSLWIHQRIADDHIELYGFETHDDLSLFEQLLTVSGIGPKKALSLLTVTDADALRSAIASGETKQVRDVTGVGKKVADKIILELRGEIEKQQEEADREQPEEDNDTLEALQALGYTAKEARDAIKHIPEGATDTSERVRHALRHLS